MDDKDVVSAFREMVRAYDLMYTDNSPIIGEIDMWRKRFLDSQGLSGVTAAYFLATPSENLMKTTPEEYLKRLGDS